MRILVVDDDAVDRLIANRILARNKSNWLVHQAASADMAEKAINEQSYDAVLVDYWMPDKSGVDLIKHLRANTNLADTAIIVVSTTSNEAVIEECMAAGAQDFVFKNELNSERIQRIILQAKKQYENEQQLLLRNSQVKYLAESDTLTGLANRYRLLKTIDNKIKASQRKPKKMALLLLDINKFRFINDDFGHDFGDKVITTFVDKLSHQMRSGQLFARLSGDSFAILLNSFDKLVEVSHFAKRLLKVINQPISLDGIDIRLTVAIGISIYPQDASDAQALIKQSEIAMYRAKREDDSSIYYFETQMQNDFLHSFRLESAMAQYIEQEQFRLYYQPIFSSCKSRLLGYEALLRWPQSDSHFEPDEFIPIAEQSKLIVPLGTWVINQALSDLPKMQSQNGQEITISINVSPLQLDTLGFIDVIQSALARHNISPENVILEITETTFMIGNERIQQVLNQIADLGIRIALDDFGTGYSSLSHLMNFPIHIVKLDKTLLVIEAGKMKHLSLIKGVVTMLKSLNMKVIAEGVEHQTQQSLCEELNLDKIQGFLLGRPMPLADAL